MSNLYLDKETGRPVSYQFVKEAIAKGADPLRFIKAYPKSDDEKEVLQQYLERRDRAN